MRGSTAPLPTEPSPQISASHPADQTGVPSIPCDVTGRPSGPRDGQPLLHLQRAVGKVDVAFARKNGGSVLQRLRQQGAAKCKFPRIWSAQPEAVLLNTAGGVTGGDRFSQTCAVDAGASLTVTTQTAERIYRSVSGEGHILNTLSVAAGGRLDWLPQETIVFDGGRLRRRLDVSMAEDATLWALEAYVLGRKAMGEKVRAGFVSDQWRIRRGGRLVFAEAMRLSDADGAFDTALSGRATAYGADAFATLILCAPDAEDRLLTARRVLNKCGLGGDAEAMAGASAWDSILCLRFLAPTGRVLRNALISALSALREEPIPRVWRL